LSIIYSYEEFASILSKLHWGQTDLLLTTIKLSSDLD